jgi:hypothetical protein
LNLSEGFARVGLSDRSIWLGVELGWHSQRVECV